MKNLTRFCAIAALCTTPTIALAGNQGDCCASNGTPGCDDPNCQEAVCAADPFCCDDTWDGICASLAEDVCTACGGSGCGEPEAGSCFQPNGTTGCDDPDCCQLICANDPFCCENEWDQVCSNTAAVACAGCGDEDAGNCCQANGTPACNDEDCCEVVCAGDPFCCENNWDSLCAGDASAACGLCGEGACCLGNDCIVMPQTQCLELDGNYTSDGTTCNQVGCFQLDIGACCVGGSCSILFEDDCFAQGGNFGGIGSVCGDIQCSCSGDANGDGNVDSLDLNIVLSDFGCTSFDCAGDIDDNGVVDSADLNIVLGGFGCFD